MFRVLFIYSILVFTLLTVNHTIGSIETKIKSKDEKLYITNHTLTVWKVNCVKDFARKHPSATIEDLKNNIDPKCEDKSINSLQEDFTYLFTFHLNKSNIEPKMVYVKVIGTDMDIPNQVLSKNKFDLLQNEDVIYLFIGKLDVHTNQVVTIKVNIVDDGKIVDKYSLKIPIINDKHGIKI